MVEGGGSDWSVGGACFLAWDGRLMRVQRLSVTGSRMLELLVLFRLSSSERSCIVVGRQQIWRSRVHIGHTWTTDVDERGHPD